MEKDYMQVLTTGVDGTAGQVAVNTGNQNGIEWKDMPAPAALTPVDSLPPATAEEYAKGKLYLNEGDLHFINKTISYDGNAEIMPTKLPKAFDGCSAVTYGDSIYVARETSVYKYTPSTETITTLPVTLPYGVRFAGACIGGSNMYIAGGNDPISGIIKIDLSSSNMQAQILPGTSKKVPYWQMPCVFKDPYIIILGGESADSIDHLMSYEINQNYLNTSGSKFSGFVNRSVAELAPDGWIYILGGQGSGTDKGTAIYRQNPATIGYGTAEKLNIKLPFQIESASSTIIGDTIYIFGGITTGYIRTDKIVSFNTKTQEIKELSAKMPHLIANTGCSELNGSAYVFGGTAKFLNPDRFEDLDEIVKISFDPTDVYSYKTLATK